MDHHSKIQGAINNLQGCLRYWVAGVVLTMGVASPITASANQQICQAVFPEAVQSHKADGEITFDWNAQLLGNTDNSLAVARVNNASWSPLPSCGGAACMASGVPAEAINININAGNSNVDHQVGYQGNLTLGNAQQKSFRTINVGSSAQVNFSSISGDYQIKKLQLGYASTLNLAPGTYWINDLILSSETKINVSGSGTARLYVKGNLQFPYKAYANMQAAGQPKSASRLLIYSQGNIDLQTDAEVSAIVYAKERLSLSQAKLYGAASFHQALIGTSSKVTYQSQAIPGASWGTFCVTTAQAPSSSSSSQSSSSSSSVNACRDIFSNGLQTHNGAGKIEFKHNAQLRNASSPILNTQSIKTNPGSNKPSCETVQCTASGLASTKFKNVSFIQSTSSTPVDIPWSANANIGADGIVNYGKVRINTSATLTFSAQQAGYKIKELMLDYNAIAKLPAGDYWIETLKLDSDSHIEVIGTGTVRLFVKNALMLNWMASINKNTLDASKTILYTYGDVSLKTSSQITGLVYSLGKGSLDHTALITGALSATNIVLDSESLVVYRSDAVNLANYGPVCDEDEPQPDLVPPVLTVNTLPQQTQQSEIAISGTVTDPVQAGSGVASVIVKLASGTQRVAILSGDIYSATLPLAAGNNAITVEARDFSGNLTTSLASVQRISVPVLEVLAPVNNAVVTQPNIRIRAKVMTAWSQASVSVSVNEVPQSLIAIADGYQFETGDLNLVLGSNEFQIVATTPDGSANTTIHITYIKPDRDGDGYPDDEDRFPDNPAEWADLDNDGIGDNSDTDRDGDGYSNEQEIAVGTNPNDPNSKPADLDNDGIPDELDDDRDGDGHNNDVDVFPNNPNEWADLDGDGIGDNSDSDRDGDGYSNQQEIEEGTDPNNAASKPTDIDNDGIPDSQDPDRDGDGHNNNVDKFPNDPTEWADLDNDGIGDNSDADRDGDGYSNDQEIALGTNPNDPASRPSDLDNDGIPDALDEDRDGDGRNNDVDTFPNNPNEWADLDGDGIGDNSDTDRDGDGYSNDQEIAEGSDPNNAASKPSDLDNDGIPDSTDPDRDGDSHNNDVDAFPNDPSEWSDLDHDGIGDNTDADRDGDGYSNDQEIALGTNPNDPSSKPSDLDNDGIPDALDNDRDGDGHNNDVDSFPNDATEWFDLDGDDIGDNSDTDRDGDGYSNEQEIAEGSDPNNAASKPSDLDNDGIPDSTDPDRDGDNHNNDVDAFPNDPSEWADLDHDGIGDNTDADRDGDGYSNEQEIALGTNPDDVSSKPADLDNDGIPDSLDDDRDGDGRNNDVDSFPNDAGEWSDLDSDGIGDNSDVDRDGDGFSNDLEVEEDTDPNNAASKPADMDNDKIPDSKDTDRDGDNHNNDVDAFPNDPGEWSDLDGDGTGDNSDADRDGDGYNNDVENDEGTDPNSATSKPADIDADGIPDSKDTDRDGDGRNNDQDAFPNDPTEWSDLDSDGIGDNADTDRDGDGYSNDIEIQEGTDPDNALSKPIDSDNDGIPDSQDADRDGDGHNNDVDAFPDDASEWSDIDGDSIGDNADEDRDGDGINNDYETQTGTDPNDASSTPDDSDNDGIPDALDTDRDGDGYNNDQDAFPSDPTEWSDLDTDGIGDNADTDRDGDGFSNDVEQQKGTNPADASDYPDIVSPLVQITNPANPQIEAATYLLQGTVSDPVQPYSGIANVSVTNNRYENAPVVAVVEGSSFTATVPLALGANTLTVRARDLSGNASEAQHQVQRIALPHFSNILPVTGSVITEKTVTVSGQVQTAMPLEQVRFYLNEWQITPSGTSQPEIYTFSLPGIPLQLGSNTFILRAETPDGAEQQSLVLVHNPENPDAIKAPEISLIAPLNNTQLRESSFTVKGRVTSYAGAVNVTVNGHAALVKASGGDTYYFEDLLAFANGQEQLSVVIEATDALNKRTQFTANYFLDNTGPQIQLAGLSPSPTVNAVAQSPVNIMGLVSDTNLASVTVNDNPVRVSPTSVAGQYAFALPLTLAPGAEISWAIAAFDRSGNKSQVEYIFKSSAQASIDPLLPAAAAEFIGDTEPLSIQVAARVNGLVGSNKVIASVGSTTVELAIAGTLASGNISVPPTAGAYVLNYQVLNENQEVIASTSRNFSVRNEQEIPVQLLRHEPENNEDLVEPNQPIELYFNKPIDTTKLEVKVYETLHGKTYLNLDPAGLDFIDAKGYQLMDVNRDRELVTGGISVLPDGKMIAFYPSRQFGFSGTLYVDVKYNNEELTHFTFKVRKLPTFVIGGIADQFGQPLAGITVTLPELGRTAVTNKDGGFAFGFQEPAGKEIPGGRHKLTVNPGFATQGYGTQVRSINLQEGFKHEIPIIRLAELHPSIPFQLISSHQAEASFVGDALRFDFSEARLLFNEGRNSGQLQYQFFQFDQLGTAVAPGAWPQWMYAGQPRGVEVEGKVGIKMNIPQRDGSYDYIPEIIRYVFIMGYNPEREVIEPVGIGEITNHQVVSVGKVALKTLDFVGYAWVHPDFQARMEAAANGQMPLQQLISELQQQ